MTPSALPLLAAATLLASLAGAARADTIKEMRIGGLAFGGTQGAVLDSQEIRISPTRITAAYRVTNTSPAPLTLSLAFAMPDLDVSDEDDHYAIPGLAAGKLVDFSVLADKAPVSFTVFEKAFKDGKDVTSVLRKADLPILAVDAMLARFTDRIAAMPTPARDRLIQQGLMFQAGTNAAGAPIYTPNWTVRTVANGAVPLPAAKSATITLSYMTSLGFAADTVLRKALRITKALEPIFQAQIRRYCVEDSLLGGVDRIAGEAADNQALLQEWRMAFDLKVNPGFPAPPRETRLVLDKGKPDRLISSCLTGVAKTSPTAFESRLPEGAPDGIIDVLLLGRPE